MLYPFGGLRELPTNDINDIIHWGLYDSHITGKSKLMANLIVRNIDEAVVRALKTRASRHGVSAEAEHRKILEQVLLGPQRKTFAEALKSIPDVGEDSDFERRQVDRAADVFD